MSLVAYATNVNPLPLLIVCTSALSIHLSFASAEGLRCLATTGMVGDLVKAVVGDRGTVDVLMSSGVDPHLYQPTRSDLAKVLQADVIFYNGLHLEGRMDESFERAQAAGRAVCAVAEAIPEDRLLQDEDHPDAYDPHVWMDPVRWRSVLMVIREQCIKMDPNGELIYSENTKKYLQELNAVDAYAERVLLSVPKDARVLVTAHDAFGYFGERFGFEVVGLQGISTESEASVQDVNQLVDLLVRRKIPAIFVESTVPKKGIRALIEGAKAKGHEVQVGGSLFSDAMGDVGSWSGTYLGMVDHNATTVAKALGGQTPTGGWRSTRESTPSDPSKSSP